MKTQSNRSEEIHYDFWATPVKEARVYLLTILQDSRHVRFFFLGKFNEKEELYELTVPTGNSYKITEENQGWKTNEYFFNGKGPKGEELQKSRTFKVWNTPYAKETYCSGLMLAEHEENPEHIFEYVIICQDEWVEFFTRAQPKWTHLEKGTRISDLIAAYLKEWGPDEE
jgi:hypothetical protein